MAIERACAEDDPRPLLYWKTDGFEGNPLPIHVLRVRLDDPAIELGVHFQPVGEPASGQLHTLKPLKAARQAGFIAAINANPFSDGHNLLTKLSALLQPGRAVTIYGDAASKGVVIRGSYDPYGGTFWQVDGGQCQIDLLPEGTLQEQADTRLAVSGFHTLLKDGEPINWGLPEGPNAQLMARSAVGLARGGHLLYLIQAEGYHHLLGKSGYSEPALARFLQAIGCDHALMLDGGGSSILMLDQGKSLQAVNPPPDYRVRPVPVLLGLRLHSKN